MEDWNIGLEGILSFLHRRACSFLKPDIPLFQRSIIPTFPPVSKTYGPEGNWGSALDYLVFSCFRTFGLS